MKLKKMIPIPENVKSIMQKLLDNNFEAYIVGGAVRDILMNLEPHDWDVFTNATGQQILELFPMGKVIGGEERQTKILTVIVEGVEVSQYRNNGDRTEVGNSLISHVRTCDFTINTIAMNIEGAIIDYVGGHRAILTRNLDFVGDAKQRISEDPLRIFRGIRFKVKYSLHYQDSLYFALINIKEYIEQLPKERIRDELMKILSLSGGLVELNAFRLLGWIIPEWSKCEHLDGGHHHAEKLGDHMLYALKNAQRLTNNSLLQLAVFLHDIGKPESHQVGEDELSTFYNHQNIGMDYVKKWMTEYRYSDKEILYVTAIIKHHMMGKTGNLSDATFIKICNELNIAGVAPEDMLVVTYSDNQANNKNPKLTYNEFLKNNGFLQRYYEIKYSRKGFNFNDLEITGHDIINEGFTTGPIIGKIKQRIFEMVSNGTVLNRRDRLLEALQQLTNEELNG